MTTPLLIETAHSSILDEVRSALDDETKAILDAARNGRRILAYMAEAYLANMPCSILTAVAACGAEDVLSAARARDALLLTDEDLTTLDAISSTAIAA